MIIADDVQTRRVCMNQAKCTGSCMRWPTPYTEHPRQKKTRTRRNAAGRRCSAAAPDRKCRRSAIGRLLHITLHTTGGGNNMGSAVSANNVRRRSHEEAVRHSPIWPADNNSPGRRRENTRRRGIRSYGARNVIRCREDVERTPCVGG